MRATFRLLALATLMVAVSLCAHQLIREAVAQQSREWHDSRPRQYNSKWKVHDIDRPKPRKVDPGDKPGAPPSDAIVLFDGTDLSSWQGGSKGIWEVRDGYMEVNNTGSIRTREKFGDCQLHLEYMAPTPPQKGDQYRGNSGILLMGHYEVQVLDNWDNPTYADGYIGAVYGQHPPLVNAARKPGEWQTYDVVFRAPRFEGEKVVEPARVTAFVNGVLVQHNAEVYGRVRWGGLAEYRPHDPELPLVLQDHGDKQKVRFRNIWIRKLDLSPEAIDNRK